MVLKMIKNKDVYVLKNEEERKVKGGVINDVATNIIIVDTTIVS